MRSDQKRSVCTFLGTIYRALACELHHQTRRDKVDRFYSHSNLCRRCQRPSWSDHAR